MSRLSIENLVLHRLHKEPHGPATVELSAQEVALTPAAQRLVEMVHEQYAARPSKGYGKFEHDEASFPLPVWLREHVQAQSLNFLALSQRLAQRWHSCLEAVPQAVGGQLLCARLRSGSVADSLLLALLPEAQGATLSVQGEVVAQPYWDIANLRVAGRVDLAAWQADSGRYLSFLKGRGEGTEYFKAVLCCDDVVVALQETKKLIKGIEQYAEASQLEPEARTELFTAAHRYLDDLGEQDLPWTVDAVVQQLSPEAPEALRATLSDETLGLAGGCIPDRRAIRPLLRFKAAAPNWKLEFNRNSLREGDVIYNRNNDTIVLYNVPDQLRRELQSEVRDRD